MTRYEQIRTEHPATILLFRYATHYEAYDDDARLVSADCDLPTIERKGRRVLGFPTKELEVHLPKLIRTGYRVLIVDGSDDLFDEIEKVASFGEIIAQIRKEQHMTIAEVAAKVGTSPANISLIESGKRQPQLDTMKRIVDAIGAEMLIRKKED